MTGLQNGTGEQDHGEARKGSLAKKMLYHSKSTCSTCLSDPAYWAKFITWGQSVHYGLILQHLSERGSIYGTKHKASISTGVFKPLNLGHPILTDHPNRAPDLR